MMIFNSFTFANDYNFGARWPRTAAVVAFSLRQIKLLKAFLQKELWILFVFKIIMYKKIIKFSFKLTYEQVN